ncbi:MAG: ACP S-malonyltransferase [Isosphaeraceae bacterium]|nr:ACP S-malonyltransferase [Isosphaeraceae bacterium]
MKNGEGRWFRRRTSMETDLNRSPLDPLGPARTSGGTAPSSSRGKLTGKDLTRRIRSTALAFRGYDVANLGRSRELLEHPEYGPVVAKVLAEASEISSAALGVGIDLAAHVRAGEKTALATFPHDVAAIVAMETAQLRLLEQFFHVPIHDVRLSFGYSIGELSALIFSGVFSLAELLPIPLLLAPDCAELAEDTTLGVLFTRKGPELHPEDVERLCTAISGEGQGLIGPSAYLSPNTALLLAQGRTLDRVEALMREYLPEKVMLRRNPNKWPPLHSPLVWQRLIPNRAAVALYKIAGNPAPPSPQVLSAVTGEASYDGLNTRDLLVRWTDHPQRLWDVIDRTLAEGVETVIHVGPGPSLIAATFSRLGNNVSRYVGYGNKYLNLLGRGLASGLSHYAWLSRRLPSKTNLLRAPYLHHVALEDWLLEQQPVAHHAVFAVSANGRASAEASAEEDSARLTSPESV